MKGAATPTLARALQARERISADMARRRTSSRLRGWHVAAWLACTAVSGPAAAALARLLSP